MKFRINHRVVWVLFSFVLVGQLAVIAWLSLGDNESQDVKSLNVYASRQAEYFNRVGRAIGRLENGDIGSAEQILSNAVRQGYIDGVIGQNREISQGEKLLVGITREIKGDNRIADEVKGVHPDLRETECENLLSVYYSATKIRDN